ncbi:unnamed protein product [Bemisia tabaci]|uniref:Constitutive coactivator of peroxisome proliferator-activated receptor gamma n=1 Tax=Bemisia tabaci TaxID=7038 RepID=A0A9P0F4N1_BEMTA|nr:unnamed protein product [Bemisia tabaci]
MGVRGLQTYLEKYCPPGCFQKVNIEDLLEQHRQETGEEHPVIIFDGSSFVPFFYRDLDWVAGGQFKEFLEKLGKIVDAFRELGVRQVYFFEGAKPERDKIPEWRWKNTEQIEAINQVFDALKKGTQVVDLKPVYYTPTFPSNLGFSHYLKDLFGVEVLISSRREVEVVDFAKKNNCFAMFCQDTDFIIYGGAKYTLSAMHFQLETMSTYNYDRNLLASHLGIQVTQLPILATLSGNGYAEYEDLRIFHQALCKDSYRPSYKVLFPALGRYIQRLPKGQALFEALPRIAKEVLHATEKARILKNSICSYSFESEVGLHAPTAANYPQWEEICKKAEELHIENLNTAVILNILRGTPYRCTVTLEDLRDTSLPPSGKLFRPMRQMLFGILLAERPPELGSQLFQEWSTEKPDCSGEFKGELYLVKPQLPAAHHPGLLALWGEDRSEEMQKIRWKLFTQAVSPNLNYHELKSLPEYLVLSTPVLVYLKEHTEMEEWEINALIATVVTLPHEPLNYLAELPSDPIDVRAVIIASIFKRGLQTVFRLLNACGFPLSAIKGISTPLL